MLFLSVLLNVFSHYAYALEDVLSLCGVGKAYAIVFFEHDYEFKSIDRIEPKPVVTDVIICCFSVLISSSIYSFYMLVSFRQDSQSIHI